ncbi:cytochrome c oxidase subunit 5A, mitochondrial [Armadillidium vulgare]|nr:cytochrome c oxidase subunit 5A, mitochondrial [Armadillidium vulgare]
MILGGMDLVPEPKIVIAALKACRRLNDIALAIRFIEAVEKMGSKAKKKYILTFFRKFDQPLMSSVSTLQKNLAMINQNWLCQLFMMFMVE